MEEKKPVYYVNHSGIMMSGFDISVIVATRFGDVANPADPPSPEDAACTIVMSPQHAKAFAANLMSAVQSYEALFGTLNIVPDQHKMQELLSKMPKMV